MILLSILLYKSNIWGNSCFWIIARKAFNQLDCRILWSHISPDRMTGSHFLHGDSQKRKKISTKFSIVCGAQRLLKSCSVTEKSIEWKINWKEETFHAFLIHNLSRQVLLSYEIAVFLDQLEVCKDYCFSFLLCVLGDA